MSADFATNPFPGLDICDSAAHYNASHASQAVHASSNSPSLFPGALMDATYRIQLWPVSLDNTTFVEYEAEWKTEPEARTIPE